MCSLMACYAGDHQNSASPRVCNFGWSTLSTVLAAALGKAGYSSAMVANGVSAMTPDDALQHLALMIEGYREGMAKPLLLPESGGAWIKACYDAANDAMLSDETTLQKAQSKFLQAYEGGMCFNRRR
jgi:exodeoxyribonuclease V gamma subunit